MKKTEKSAPSRSWAKHIPVFFRETWLFLALFLAGMGYVFFPVLSTGQALTSPDDSPFYAVNYFVLQMDELLSGRIPFMFQRFFNILSPVFCHDIAYITCLLLLGLSGVYYLRTQRISRLAACGGGLFLAFSGYLSTLFCAGHLGFFYLLASVFWSFGLLARGFETGQWRYFALLGCVLMWGQPGQPDVWILCAGALAAYALWRGWLTWRLERSVKRLLVTLAPRLLVTLLLAGLVGAPGIRHVFAENLATRDKQILDTARAAGEQSADGSQQDQKAFERWIFATGWSLPPVDCAEFLIPGIFGNDSFRAPYPYWGRLGQPYAFQPGRMMPNYRQHTLYLGLVPVLLACFGVMAWLLGRKASKQTLPQTTASPQPTAMGARLPLPQLSDVPFWCVVWLLCLILAMGRYTPAYQLFYAIPYMDYLRAPVKFLHLTEVATALLAGLGLEAVLSRRTPLRIERGFRLAVFALAGLLGVAAILVLLGSPAIEKHIAGLGLGPAADALSGYAVYNCLRAAGIAMAVALALWLIAKHSTGGRLLTVLACGLVALSVADMALIARRYVIPINVQPFHEENLVIREMRKRTHGRPAHVANYVTRNVLHQDWFNTSLASHGFPNLLPDPADTNAPDRPFAVAFQDNPMRFWQVMGIRFVMLSRQQAEPLILQKALIPVGEFELASDHIRRATSGGRAFILAETQQGALPCIYFAWTGGIAPDKQVAQACEKGQILPVTDAVDAAAPSDRLPQPVAFTQVRGERNVFVTKAVWEAPEAGLLVWNERYSPNLAAWIDGKIAPLHQVDGRWCAVAVPAGRHVLTCRMRYQPLWNAISAGVSLAVILAVIGVTLLPKKAC
jgi:hypothetical protein